MLQLLIQANINVVDVVELYVGERRKMNNGCDDNDDDYSYDADADYCGNTPDTLDYYENTVLSNLK